MHRPIRTSVRRTPARRLTALSVALAAPLALAACSSSSDDPATPTGGGAGDSPGQGPGQEMGGGGAGGSGSGNAVPLIEGDITRYGVVNVADEAGTASDAIAAFNRASPGVGALAFGTAADPDGTPCTVVPSSSNGNDLLFVGYAPLANGARNTAIMAGDTVTLTSAQGTWATLVAGSASSVDFYEGPVPPGEVPANLQVDVSAASDADGFPALTTALSMPSVTALTGFAQSPAGAISADTTYRWDASDDPASRVRIVASTGFFSDDENGKRVSCLVPDTGSFAYPADVRAELGAEFQGEPFLTSRLSIGTRQEGGALLFLIRESFTE